MLSYILPYDKPPGPTSHDIVWRMRRELGEKRIGHTGTLDPFASGLLLLCVGNATRLAEYLTDLPKSYHATARFDGSTPTDDNTVERTTTTDVIPDEAAVRDALLSQIGRRAQMPSAFSAKKIAGERAYDIARRGDVVELTPVEIEIYDLRITRINLPDVEFEVDCSSGTYVRAIARDAGATLGTGGYLSALRRTSVGGIDLSRAGERIPMLDAIAHMPRVDIDEAEERALRFGQLVERAAEQGTLAAARDNELIAIVASDGKHIKPKKVFPVA